MTERDGRESMPEELFKERKKAIIEMSNYATISKAGRRSYSEDSFSIIDSPKKDTILSYINGKMVSFAFNEPYYCHGSPVFPPK